MRQAKLVTTIPVVDLDRAKVPCGPTLGLRLLFESGPSVRFEAGGGSEVSIFRRVPTRADHTAGHFEVNDLAALVHDLEAAGVELIDYTDGPHRTTRHIAQIGPALGASVHDTERNILGLRQG